MWTDHTEVDRARYFVTFIDDHSRKVFAYTMKNKSEVVTKFSIFKNLVENHLNASIKTIRTDNGKEYVNNDMDNLCKKFGIRHEKSAPYSPQQNGVSERMNRTLIEKVRCMLFDAKLTKGFWAEALFAAVDVVNVLPNSSINNLSPSELWFGRKPDIAHFKIFGSRAMVMVPQQKRKKLDKKSLECILLRHADDSKAYRFYDKVSKKILISRDVIFLENEKVQMSSNSEDNFIHSFSEIDNQPVTNSEGENSMIELPTVESEREQSAPMIDNGENSTTYEINDSTANDNDNSVTDDIENSVLGSPNGVNNQSNSNESDQDVYDDVNGDPTYTTRALMPDGTDRPNTRRFPFMGSTFFNLHVALADDTEPKTFHEASKSSKWMSAMREEYDSLIKNDTWKLVERPSSRNIIDNRWVYKVKRNDDESVERYKARLVARGFTQEYGSDYHETFSPVVRFTSIRSILAIAAQRKMHLKQFDVKTAFLNGDLNEVIYMEQPKGFTDGTNKVCKLQRSLYGLKQASRCWNKKFNKFIQLFGFVTCKADSCVFVSRRDGKMIVLAIHVDDGLIAGDDDKCIREAVSYLQTHFEIKLMSVGCFLGLQIVQENDGSIFLHQKAYANRISNRFNMGNCNAVTTPSDPNQVLHGFIDSEPSNYPYREAVGSLMYLSLGTRPDITYSVGIASRHQENPTIVHENAVKRILKYLKGTVNFGITYSSRDRPELNGYSDSDNNNNHLFCVDLVQVDMSYIVQRYK